MVRDDSQFDLCGDSTDSSQADLYGDSTDESQALEPISDWTQLETGRWTQHAAKDNATRTLHHYNAGLPEDGSQSYPSTDDS